MKEELLTIQQAASYLGVSTKTLRRWEAKGVLVPERTIGNQRRYTVSELQQFKQRGKLPFATTANQEYVPQVTFATTQPAPIPQTERQPVFSPPVPPITGYPAATSTSNPGVISPDTYRSPTKAAPKPEKQTHVQVYLNNVQERVQLLSTKIRRRKLFPTVPLALAGLIITTAVIFAATHSGPKSNSSDLGKTPDKASVLQAATNGNSLLGDVTFNIPAIFNSKVTIKNDFAVDGKSLFNDDIKVNNKNVDLGTGKLTASNVVYSLIAGNNISITGDPQNPTITANVDESAAVSSLQGQTGAVTLAAGTGIDLNGLEISNTGVLSLQGQTGAVTLTAGTGIGVSGTTISNSDPGSSQNIFKTVLVNATSIVAGSNSDTLTFTAGTGITITPDANAKSLTISSSSTGTLSGLTTNGVLYATSTTAATSTSPGATGTVLKGVTGSAPVFGAVDLTADVTGVLPIANGGTGTSSTPSNGQLLIGNGTDYTLSALTGTANQISVTNGSGSITLATPQDIHTGASPTFAALNLSNTTNQIILGSGNTATITMAALNASRTFTLPNQSGEICVSSGNCSGVGGSITGSGTTNYIPKFSSATGIGDSSIYDSGGKIGIGTTSPQGLFSVFGGSAGTALVSLNETGDQNILVGSASGTTRFVFDRSGNLNLASGNYQIGGVSVLGSTSLGATVVSSSLTSVGTLAGGSISSGFGAIDTGTDAISGGDLTSTGTTGLTLSGNGAGITFSGSSNHAISASSGTLQLGAATLIGAITGNSQNVTGLNNLSAAGTITFGGLSSGVVKSDGSGILSSSAVALTTDTSGNYVADVSGGSGITVSGSAGEGWTPSVALGALTGNWSQTGAFDIVLNNAASELSILESSGGTFYGILDVTDLSADRTYTFPNSAGTVCLVEAGNCAGSGTGVTTAGGTTDRLVKFSGAQAVGDASINDLYTSGVSMTIAASGNVGIGTANPTSLLHVNGGTTGGNAAAVINQTGASGNDIFTASSSGTTQFVINNNGNVQFTGNSGFLQTLTSNAAAAKSYNFPTFTGSSADICLSTGNCAGVGGVGDIDAVGSMTSGSAFADSTADDDWLGLGASAGRIEFDDQTIDEINLLSSKIGIGTSTPTGLLDITGSITGKALTILNETGNQAILTGSSSGTTRFVFDSSGNLNINGGGYQIAGTTVLDSSRNLSSIGTIDSTYIDASANVINLAASTELQFNGTTVISSSRQFQNIASIATDLTPSVNNTYSLGTNANRYANIYGQAIYQNGNQVCDTGGNCSGLSTNYWDQANGALSAKNTTVDLLIGGIASISAKFAVLNVNNGTPVASVSAGSAGAAFLTASGNLQTTANQTLTLGGGDTGNIILNSGAGGISILDGVTLAANFTQTGATAFTTGTGQVTLSGNVDATNGLDVTGANLTVNGLASITTAGAITGTQIDIDGTIQLNGTTLSSLSGNDLTLDAAGSNIVFGDADTFIIGGHAGNVAYNVISDSGGSPASGQVASDDDLFVEGTIEAGALYQGANQVCDTSGNCAGGTNYLQLNSGVLAPGNSATVTDKFVLGGSTTTPFQFEVNGKQTGKALVSLNETGNQDIFTASASGTTRFVINNSGNLQLAAGTTIDTLTSGTLGIGTTNVTTLTLGRSGQNISLAGYNNCGMLTTSGTTLTCSAAPAGTTEHLTITSGLLHNGNLSTDFAIGGTSSSSAKFLVSPSGTRPTASVSANTSYAGLVVDNTGFGDLFAASSSGLNRFVIKQNGNVGIGLANPETFVDIRKDQNTSTELRLSNKIGAGNTSGYALLTVEANTASGFLAAFPADYNAGYRQDKFVLGTNSDASALSLNAVGATQHISFYSGSTTETARFDSSGNFGIGATSPLARLDVRGNSGTTPIASFSGQTSNAGLIVDNGGSGDLFAASSSGLSRFVIKQNGTVGIGTEMPTAMLDVAGAASVSGSLNFRAGTGTIQTTANNALTIGGDTTGKITLMPNNGAGIINLDVAASNGLQINGTNGATVSSASCVTTSNGIVTGSAACEPGADSWTAAAGILHTSNQTMDVLIGGTASTSAKVKFSPSGTAPTASIAGTTSYAAMVVNNDGVGDIFTASKSGKTHFTIRNSGAVVIGNATDGITFDVNNSSVVYAGNARPTKKIVLSPEYAGAILTASGSATTNGFMTSDASASAALSNFRTYYEWTSSQTSLQDYTVGVRVTLPHDFGAWTTSNALQINYNTELGANGSNKLETRIYNTDSSLTAAQAATPVAYFQNQSSSAKTWTSLDIDDSDLDDGTAQEIDTAGDTFIIYLKMYSRDNNHVQIGDITLNYLGRN